MAAVLAPRAGLAAEVLVFASGFTVFDFPRGMNSLPEMER
jgi:hypothetical protein